MPPALPLARHARAPMSTRPPTTSAARSCAATPRLRVRTAHPSYLPKSTADPLSTNGSLSTVDGASRLSRCIARCCSQSTWRRHPDISPAWRSQPRCVAALDVQSRPAVGPRALPAKGRRWLAGMAARPRSNAVSPTPIAHGQLEPTSSHARSAGATLLAVALWEQEHGGALRRAPAKPFRALKLRAVSHNVRTHRSPDRARRDCAPGCRGPGDPLGRHRSPLG